MVRVGRGLKHRLIKYTEMFLKDGADLLFWSKAETQQIKMHLRIVTNKCYDAKFHLQISFAITWNKDQPWRENKVQADYQN